MSQHALPLGPTKLKRLIALALMSVPLIAGAAYTSTAKLDPAATWSVGEEREGAPAAIDDSVLVDARRATGEASSQAGFLKNGTQELVDATSGIAGRTGEVTGPIAQARDGSARLSNGMVELQAATGQLGDGATKVADGVETAVNQVIGLEAVRGQILAALDRHIEDLKNTKNSDLVRLRDQMRGFREQVLTFQLDEATRRQLEDLRGGSREIANQLAVPGYGYHDGIYTATKGSKELADGLAKLDEGVGQALGKVGELEDGAKKIDDMAGLTKERISAIQRAMPIVSAGTSEAQERGVQQTLAPMYAFLIAALVLLGAGLRGRNTRVLSIITAAVLAALAAGLAALLGTGMETQQVMGVAATSFLLALASILTGSIFIRVFGTTGGQILALVGAGTQLAVVGWAWNLASTSQISSTWLTVSSLMPVHYPTAAIAALGNSGSNNSIGLGIGVLAALCIMGFAGLKMLNPKHLEA
ncbi:hypothetical protein P4N68_08730 [Corynebacterium felinum]|uniref:X-X-X-Leu-X-X-Gly heptad repeat protein n=1 Tax=Corynebacterium felinum TaxID=131318 RepID=A0ABU2B7A1_9CORY|nr:hypothetical protein [Corynebacterium felinum]MDF5821161.1 hypothetical protein [Corynebacterium felinum]MDR7354487.1 X-X-X-Leu-X-X-Gly heptad repeat protein [Corynebacterium felinum]WJY93856.1 hypothetical protein CFELI_01035 [Corynebacterium felinum]